MKRLIPLLFFPVISVSDARISEADLLDSVCVEIEQKGDNPSVAKDKALGIAARFAFEDALSTQLNCHVKTDSITNSQISNCLYEYTIEDEKYSAFVYIAKITYCFNYHLVAELLRSRGIGFSEKIAVKSEKTQKKNTKRQKILMRTEDFMDVISGKSDFDYRIEKISQKRIILSADSEKLDSIKAPYLQLR